MRLTTKSFKLVADEDVRPFILTSQPEAGENLIGFISRVMADQAFSSLSAGLSLAGIGCTRPDKIASLLRDDTQIANLAKLLKIPVVELERLLEPATTRPGTRIKLTTFCGMQVLSRYRAFDRRVSPRALSACNIHQARWSLRPLNFDPVTGELLLGTCPECKRPLSWWRSFGPSKCDKCLDSAGRPLVDLRDFHQPLIEIEDERALKFVADIVHHDPRVREKAANRVGSLWRGLTPSDIFDTLTALAWAKLSLLEQNLHLGRPTRPEQYAEFHARDVLGAAQILLGGDDDLSRYVTDALERVARSSGIKGSKASFGRVGCLPDDQYLAPQVKSIIDRSLQAARHDFGIPRRGGTKRSAIENSHGSEEPTLGLRPGYTRTGQAAVQCGMHSDMFGKAVQAAEMDPYVQRGVKYTIGVDLDALRAAFPAIFDSVGPFDAAAMLKVPASGLATLVKAGLVTESFCVTRGKQLLRRYSRASVNALASDLQQAVTSTDAAPKTIRQAMAIARWPHADSAVTIIYVTRFKWNLVLLGGAAADWRDGLGIRDMDHFITEATRLRKLYATQDVYLKRAEVLQILGCSYSALAGLESSGLVRPAKSPMKHARYIRAEIETFRKTYVLFDEVRKRCGLRGPKQIFFTLSGLGLKPLFDWGDKAPLVFHRARFDRVLKALNLDQATQKRAA